MNSNTVNAVKETAGRKFITKVYGWMVIAMLISAAAALATTLGYYNSESFRYMLASFGYITLIVLELILVFVLSLAIKKMPVGLAALFFVLYSVVDGMTLSSIFIVYNINSIGLCFVICALMFLAMSIYGSVTKSNLTSAGRYLFMALIGVVIASVLNLLFKSTVLDWIISLISVVIFVGLTAYDTQKIVKASEYYNESDAFKKAAIVSALELYLDFINMFLSILRLFGKRKN